MGQMPTLPSPGAGPGGYPPPASGPGGYTLPASGPAGYPPPASGPGNYPPPAPSPISGPGSYPPPISGPGSYPPPIPTPAFGPIGYPPPAPLSPPGPGGFSPVAPVGFVTAVPARWHALRTIAGLLKVVAWIAARIGAIAVLIALIAGGSLLGGYGILGGLFFAIIVAIQVSVIFLALFGYAEMILVILAIEENTRVKVVPGAGS